MLRRSAILLLLPATAACGSDDEAPAEGRSGWRVEGRFVRDPEGRAVVLRGVNLANAHKQKPYLGFHQPADFARLGDEWGLNHVRFLVLWAGLEPERDQWDEAYLDAIAERMDWAEQAGLVVVLDMHQDIYGEGFGGDGAPRWTCDESHYQKYTPVEPWFMNYLDPEVVACVDGFWQSDELRSHYLEAWRRVAARLGEHPAVIGFDPMNEPFWGSHPTTTFEREVLGPFYEDVTRVVREHAPGWIAFMEPFAGKNLGFPSSLEPPKVRDVVFAPHAYDTNAESGKGFDPGARAAFIARIAALDTQASELGLPLWIGEYGGPSGATGIEAYVDAAYDGTAAVAAGSAYWAYDRDEGYGLLDPSGAEKANVLAQVVRPYPERIAGAPLSFEFDEAASRFSLRYEPDASVSAPTVLRVPERVYPGGYAVTCGGCESELSAGKLVITRAPAGTPAVVELEPL